MIGPLRPVNRAPRGIRDAQHVKSRAPAHLVEPRGDVGHVPRLDRLREAFPNGRVAKRRLHRCEALIVELAGCIQVLPHPVFGLVVELPPQKASADRS